MSKLLLKSEAFAIPTLAFYDGGGNQLATADTKGLIERVLAGEHLEIEIEGRMYLQSNKAGVNPNRNYIRFKNSAMSKFAKSGKNTPFLRDHAQHSLADRGGTVVDSKLIKDEDGTLAIEQRVRLTTPWAVMGALNGTIDRFSIGWHPTGPIVYAHSGEDIGWPDKWPAHWPGDKLEDGTIIEWEFTSADLVEVSAVNVPAVVGTGVEEIRAALAANLGEVSRVTKEERMSALMKRLGLSSDAAEVSALAAVDRLEQDCAAATQLAEASALELKAERESHDRTKAQLSEYQERDAKAQGARFEEDLGKLYADGRLTASRDAEGNRLPDPYEATLREVKAKLGEGTFRAMASKLTSKIPVGRQTEDVDPNPKTPLVLTERHKKMISQMGLTEDQYRKNLEKGGRI